LGLKKGDVETLITQGDSTCHPDGDTQSAFESFTHVAARVLGIAKENVHNLGIPGIGIPEVRMQLRDPHIRHLLLTAKKPVLVVSLNGNDWRAMVSEQMRRHLEVLRKMGRPTLPHLLARVSSVFAVAIKHSDTARFFETEFSKYLFEVAALNQERDDLDPIHLVITTPPDFSNSPGITFVPTEQNKDHVNGEIFDTSEETVRRVVNVVALTVAGSIIDAHTNFKRKRSLLNTAIISLADSAKQRHHFGRDQHLTPETHIVFGRQLALAIAPQAA